MTEKMQDEDLRACQPVADSQRPPSTPFRVLVACEFSGTVREAFRRRGHDAWSCDLLETEHPSPYHIVGDVLDVLWGHPEGAQWDLLVAHPPCTHLAVSGARWFKEKRSEQDAALAFVRELLNAPTCARGVPADSMPSPSPSPERRDDRWPI